MVCKLNDCEATFNLGVWWGQTWMWLQAGQDELGGKELQPKSCQSWDARIQLLILVETYKLKLTVCCVHDRILFSGEEVGDKDGDDERGQGQEDCGAAGAQQRPLQQAWGVWGAIQQPVGCLKVIDCCYTCTNNSERWESRIWLWFTLFDIFQVKVQNDGVKEKIIGR